MRKRIALGVALCAWAAPANAIPDTLVAALGATEPESLVSPAKPDPVADAGPPAPAGWRPKLWFQIAVAPEIVSETPFTDHNDATEISWTMGLETNLAPWLKFKFTLGPSATVDSDGDSGERSSLNAGFDFRTSNPIGWNVTPSFTYKISRRYEGFFGDRDGTDHTLEAALNYQRKFNGLTFEFALVSRRLQSTRSNSDYWAARLLPTLTIPVFNNTTDLTLSVSAERRLFDDINASIGRNRRDWRLEAGAGLNFARGINSYLNRSLPKESRHDIFRDFLIGARWIGIDSNVGDEDNSTLKFTPSISIRIGF